jgi:hypothetical protein
VLFGAFEFERLSIPPAGQRVQIPSLPSGIFPSSSTTALYSPIDAGLFVTGLCLAAFLVASGIFGLLLVHATPIGSAKVGLSGQILGRLSVA